MGRVSNPGAAVRDDAVLALYLGALALPPFGTLLALCVALRGASPRAAAALEAHALRALKHQVLGTLALAVVQVVVLAVAWAARDRVAPDGIGALALFAGDAVACFAILGVTAVAGTAGLRRGRAGRPAPLPGRVANGRPTGPPGERAPRAPRPSGPAPADAGPRAHLDPGAADAPSRLLYRPRPTTPARDRAASPAAVEDAGAPARLPRTG